MSDLDDLPSWAGQPTDVRGTPGDDGRILAADAGGPPVAPHAPPPRKRRGVMRTLLMVLLGALVLFGIGAAGYLLAESQNDTATEAADPAGPETGAVLGSDVQEQDSSADSDGGTAAGTTDDATSDGAASDDAMADEDSAAEDGTTEDTATDGTAADDASSSDGGADETTDGATTETTSDEAAGGEGEPDRQAIFRGGKVYLLGKVPSEEIGQLIEQRAAAVVGPDNVVNEYTIDPTVTIEPGSSAPLYVEDVVLFEFNSVSVAPPFLPILDLGTLLLRLNPQASVTIVTRTDAVGDEETNLDVARKRGQAIANYWLAQGVNPSQIAIDARGEEGASEDDDEQTAAMRRRAEFIITGLLD